jgi:hypothetical protein
MATLREAPRKHRRVDLEQRLPNVECDSNEIG